MIGINMVVMTELQSTVDFLDHLSIVLTIKHSGIILSPCAPHDSLDLPKHMSNKNQVIYQFFLNILKLFIWFC